MNIFFDMDYTILSATGRLRPRVVETFNQLREDGHSLYIWSGIGVRVAEVRNLGLLPWYKASTKSLCRTTSGC